MLQYNLFKPAYMHNSNQEQFEVHNLWRKNCQLRQMDYISYRLNKWKENSN